MRLNRLAGHGPAGAFVSAVSLAVFFLLLLFGTTIAAVAPALNAPFAVALLITLLLWLAGFAVVVFDLEWMEHPATSTRLFRIAHWITLAAVVLPMLLGVAILIDSATLGAVALGLLGLTAGISLLIHNLDARRAGLVRGVMPWLGVVSGGGYMLMALGQLGLEVLEFAGLVVGQTFYIAWAVSMGVWLRRTRSVAVDRQDDQQRRPEKDQP
jgi:hypothetical protein